MFFRLLERILAPIIDRRIEASREREANTPHQRELDRDRRSRLAELLDSGPAIADFDVCIGSYDRALAEKVSQLPG